MESAEIIVVGGGLAGLSTAWHLAQTRSVLLLEQGPCLAAEASGQNSALIRRMDLEPHERALSRRTFAWLQDPHPDWTSPPSQKTGAVLALGRDPLHLHDAVAHMRASGVKIESVDRPHALSPALAESPLVRAWYLPDEHTADLPVLVAGFVRGLQRMGTQVQCGQTVRALIQGPSGHIQGVQTDHGPIHADTVVLAGGAWCQPLAATVGLHRPLIPLRRTVVISQTRIAPSGPWIWVDDVGVYIRPDAEGWLGSPCDEAVTSPPIGPGSTGTPATSQVALLQTKLQRYFPSLGAPEPVRGWTGLRTFAPDRRPLLGEDPQCPGLWWAAGLGGAGLSGCIGLGQALSSWINGEQTDWLERAPLQPNRTPMSRWPILPDGDPQHARLVSTPQAP